MYEIIFRERSNNVSGLREKRMKRRFITFLLDFYNTIQCSRVKNLEFLIREMLENGIQKVENFGWKTSSIKFIQMRFGI